MKNYTLDLPVIVDGLVISVEENSAIVDIEGKHHKVPTKAWLATPSSLSVGDEAQVLIAPISGQILSISARTS